LTLVFGASADKDIAGMARVLGPVANRVIVTASGHRRAANVAPLLSEFGRYTRVEANPDPAGAFTAALATSAPGDLVLIAGSVFLAGKALEILGVQGTGRT
jgi:dihydrofolate synthase/folylpolyglutamate synthase